MSGNLAQVLEEIKSVALKVMCALTIMESVHKRASVKLQKKVTVVLAYVTEIEPLLQYSVAWSPVFIREVEFHFRSVLAHMYNARILIIQTQMDHIRAQQKNYVL